eukprot:Opistho-2@31569
MTCGCCLYGVVHAIDHSLIADINLVPLTLSQPSPTHSFSTFSHSLFRLCVCARLLQVGPILMRDEDIAAASPETKQLIDGEVQLLVRVSTRYPSRDAPGAFGFAFVVYFFIC